VSALGRGLQGVCEGGELRMATWSQVQSPMAAGLAYTAYRLHARSVCDTMAQLQLRLVTLY